MAEEVGEGLYPKWDGKRLYKKRARIQPRSWALVYQQEQVNSAAIFSPEMLAAAVNGARLTGIMPKKHNAVRQGVVGTDLFTSWV